MPAICVANLGDFLQVFWASGVDQHPPKARRNRQNLCPDCFTLEGLGVLQISELFSQLDLKLHTGLESPAPTSHSTQPEKVMLKTSPSSPSSSQFPNPSKRWPDQGLWPCHGLQIFQVRLELPHEGRGCDVAELLLLGQGLREARQCPKFVDVQGQLNVVLTHGIKQFHQGV